MLINQVSNNYNYPQAQYKLQATKSAVSFSGKGENTEAKPESKFFPKLKEFFKDEIAYYDSKVERLAHCIGDVFDTKLAYKTIQKTKKCNSLFNHLMTTGSVVLSSLYVYKTLTNKDLDVKKRNTLAINQSIVFGLSTVMCYVADSKMNAWTDKFAKTFEAVNLKAAKKVEKELIDGKNPKNPLTLDKLKKCVKGVNVAGKIVLIDTIYRFIAPVFVTPVANKLGDDYNAKHKK